MARMFILAYPKVHSQFQWIWPGCILCGGCTQPIAISWFDPVPPISESKLALKLKPSHPHRRIPRAPRPPWLNPHPHLAHRDGTPAPTSAAVIWPGDDDTNRWAATMEHTHHNLGCCDFNRWHPRVRFQLASPRLPFQPVVHRAPISTGGASASNLNQCWDCLLSELKP
jgi:hypothetical protein